MSAQKEGTAKTDYYPGKQYQRLFNYLNNLWQGNALQSEMDDIIQIVNEDFSQSPAAGVKGGNESLYPLWVRASERVPEENRKVYARKVDNKNYTLLLTWYRESQEFGEYGANYWYKKNEIEWLDESPSGQEQGQAAEVERLKEEIERFKNTQKVMGITFEKELKRLKGLVVHLFKCTRTYELLTHNRKLEVLDKFKSENNL